MILNSSKVVIEIDRGYFHLGKKEVNMTQHEFLYMGLMLIFSIVIRICPCWRVFIMYGNRSVKEGQVESC